ncbi:MAG TPA: hypothetical protein VMR62_16035 [Bryobacteraceae bacterium]|nr:hypothetical protein [Bryobacteraceae bacterium]
MPRPANVLRFLAMGGLCALPLLGLGQNLTGSSNCDAPDFDAGVQFRNGPGDFFTVVIDNRNLSSHSCVFDGPMYGPSPVPDRIEGHPPFGLCYYCENGLPNTASPRVPPLTVLPGQAARQTFSWRTKPADETGGCLQLKWMSGPVLLNVPSLLPKVCSDIDVSGFSLAATPDGEPTPAFELTSDRSTYYEAERFSVGIALIRPGPPLSIENGCPVLYMRQRSPDGETRIDEVQPLAFNGCPTILGHQPGDWHSGFELDSGASARWMGLGEHVLQVLQLVSSPHDSQIRFATSNILRIQLADASAIPRKWGPRVKGIAADITLDKETFRIGENVRLHLAVEDFDAEVPIYAWDPLWDPCVAIGLEVRHASGNPLPADERFPNWSFCTGHGLGPRPVAKGKAIPLERTLGEEGWLPNHAGTYTIVVIWAPCADANAPATNPVPDLKTYAVVQATAVIHIVSDGR